MSAKPKYDVSTIKEFYWRQAVVIAFMSVLSGNISEDSFVDFVPVGVQIAIYISGIIIASESIRRKIPKPGTP